MYSLGIARPRWKLASRETYNQAETRLMFLLVLCRNSRLISLVTESCMQPFLPSLTIEQIDSPHRSSLAGICHRIA
jgi:hypothetical protein